MGLEQRWRNVIDSWHATLAFWLGGVCLPGMHLRCCEARFRKAPCEERRLSSANIDGSSGYQVVRNLLVKKLVGRHCLDSERGGGPREGGGLSW